MQIFSLYWMMQIISFLNMFPRSPSGFTDIKKTNVLHHPVQGKILHFNPKIFYRKYLAILKVPMHTGWCNKKVARWFVRLYGRDLCLVATSS